MRLRSYLALGALALAPVLALAGETSAQMDARHAAQPMFVNVNGQAVPVKAETHVVHTPMGPMKVSTWSWHSPSGSASYEVQTSTGGAPSAAALRQMQMAQAQMVAMQQQMVAMQQQMMALQHAAFAGGFAVPAPQNVVFAVPLWAMPDPVVIVEPAQRAPAPAVAPPSSPPTAPARSPGIRA